MKCPDCGKPMRAGYIQGARGVLFSEHDKTLFVVKNPFSKKDKTIAGVWECASPAFYCDDCDCLVWKKGYREEPQL